MITACVMICPPAEMQTRAASAPRAVSKLTIRLTLTAMVMQIAASWHLLAMIQIDTLTMDHAGLEGGLTPRICPAPVGPSPAAAHQGVVR